MCLCIYVYIYLCTHLFVCTHIYNIGCHRITLKLCEFVNCFVYVLYIFIIVWTTEPVVFKIFQRKLEDMW